MSKKFLITFKGAKSTTGERKLNTPVLALNVRMIDRCLRKAGLQELQELIRPDGETEWVTSAKAVRILQGALKYFEENSQALAFSDLVVEEIPVAIRGIRAIPGRSLRLSVVS